ncbi:hypothetical protein VEx25_B0271, partial [Vibrio antiquarius]
MAHTYLQVTLRMQHHQGSRP